MPVKEKDSSSSNSNNNSLDEIKALLNEKFDYFRKKLISIEKKFDITAREIYIKREQVEKKAEDAKANASNNSDEIESLKFEMKGQSEKTVNSLKQSVS